jgi:hypothetical protein
MHPKPTQAKPNWHRFLIWEGQTSGTRCTLFSARSCSPEGAKTSQMDVFIYNPPIPALKTPAQCAQQRGNPPVSNSAGIYIYLHIPAPLRFTPCTPPSYPAPTASKISYPAPTNKPHPPPAPPAIHACD